MAIGNRNITNTISEFRNLLYKLLCSQCCFSFNTKIQNKVFENKNKFHYTVIEIELNH